MMREDERTKLEELAYQQGRRDADVDSRLLGHERRLNAINGSIEKHAVNAEKLRKEIEGLGKKIDGLAALQSADDAVEADREKRHNEGLTRLQTIAICVGVPTAIAVPILSAFIAAGKLF